MSTRHWHRDNKLTLKGWCKFIFYSLKNMCMYQKHGFQRNKIQACTAKVSYVCMYIYIYVILRSRIEWTVVVQWCWIQGNKLETTHKLIYWLYKIYLNIRRNFELWNWRRRMAARHFNVFFHLNKLDWLYVSSLPGNESNTENIIDLKATQSKRLAPLCFVDLFAWN